MKNKEKRTWLLLMSMSLLLSFLTGCEETEDDNIIESEEISSVQLQLSDETELVLEELVNIGDDIFASKDVFLLNKAYSTSGYIPDCATITTIVSDNSKEISIAFGDGCEFAGGNILSGTIIFNVILNPEALNKSIEMDLSNFRFNEVEVEGYASILRTAQESGGPLSVIDYSFIGSWPDGLSRKMEGQRTRQWIAGFGNGFWGDNVVSITGESQFTTADGEVFNRMITSPLRREWSCRFLVSGIIEVDKKDLKYSIDFGDGTCDAKGVITKPDGSTTEIFLRRFFQ
ncbi:hypothetical protein [Eudoraea chungangensis]|uniref:hypothetical protein n=1 Tax=Eudoraea chungangensis TaxID=1481905 RepID=UPI0023ED39BA|nr:hypothetical protein [Eudoraea chungangensis]